MHTKAINCKWLLKKLRGKGISVQKRKNSGVNFYNFYYHDQKIHFNDKDLGADYERIWEYVQTYFINIREDFEDIKYRVVGKIKYYPKIEANFDIKRGKESKIDIKTEDRMAITMLESEDIIPLLDYINESY